MKYIYTLKYSNNKSHRIWFYNAKVNYCDDAHISVNENGDIYIVSKRKVDFFNDHQSFVTEQKDSEYCLLIETDRWLDARSKR